MYVTDVRQHHRLMPPRRGHNKEVGPGRPGICCGQGYDAE